MPSELTSCVVVRKKTLEDTSFSFHCYQFLFTWRYKMDTLLNLRSLLSSSQYIWHLFCRLLADIPGFVIKAVRYSMVGMHLALKTFWANSWGQAGNTEELLNYGVSWVWLKLQTNAYPDRYGPRVQQPCSTGEEPLPAWANMSVLIARLQMWQ